MRLLGFLLPPWLLPALGALALAGAFWGGWTVQGWRCGAKQTEALERAQKRFDAQLAKQNEEATEYEQDREQGRQDSRARETAIRTIYRDRIVLAECEPPADALRVLDDAIGAANARAAGEPGASVPAAADPS